MRTPISLGIPQNGYSANVGAMLSQGMELGLNTVNIRPEDFTWNTNFNFSTNQTEITRLANNNEDILNPYNVTRLGNGIGEIYGYDFQGVNPANGNPLYKKRNGSLVQGNLNTGTYAVYNPANPGDVSQAATLSAATDRFMLGHSNPTYFGGLTNTVTYKGFDFELFLRYSGGNKIMNVTRQQLLRMDFVNNSTEILGRWTTPGQVNRRAQGHPGPLGLHQPQQRGLDALRGRRRLHPPAEHYAGLHPAQVRAGGTTLGRVRVYAQVQNALTFTEYKGVDPEVNANITATQGNTSNNQSGIDFNSNPQQRVFTGGLNVAF